ncbi:MAG: hypothetical protein IJM76_05975 [Lachnospiraceae bacterium]|nr:hypothetical protein [Lachnospiraceae bacterium]
MTREDIVFKVDGVTIPVPTTYEWSQEDLSSEETGRTLDGMMHKDVVAYKDVYRCTWSRLTWQETAVLLGAIKGKSKVLLQYADPLVPGAMNTGYFYVGKRQTAALDLSDPGRAWKDIAFAFTEV